MSMPLLSIGIIFKNEIRCLERCLKSLQPLRDMIPCELVMADTGSDDGSREVAAKYADILFDFPWINDFAAARNAVMDRCSGDWYFSIDADEWLGGDVSELKRFVRSGRKIKGNVACVSILNYATPDLDENYAEFLVYRIFRMSTGLRYEGIIHERWPYEKSGNRAEYQLTHVILHHDGYVYLSEETKKAKRERNLSLLRKQLEENPENIKTLLQYLESGKTESDYLEKIRLAMELTREKRDGWIAYGPAIFRYAVILAKERNLPELKEWIEEAKERFPKSLFTRIDVDYTDFVRAWDEKDHAKCIAIGERCLRAMIDLKEGRIDKDELAYSAVVMQGPHWEEELKTFLAESFLQEKQPEKCREYLERLSYNHLGQKQTTRMLHTMMDLHTQSEEGAADLVKAAWAGILEPVPSQEQAEKRKYSFLQEASEAFQRPKEDKGRPAYTLFLPLAGECEVGNAAAILEQTDAAELEQLLAQVEKWDELPIQALAHVLECDACFPLPEKPLNIEEIDVLVARLAHIEDGMRLLVEQTTEREIPDHIQELVWTRGMVFAAVRKFDWNSEDADVEQGMALIRAFTEVEKKYLPLCYAPEAVREENLFLLPAMHRFGVYCVHAFNTLRNGNTVEYVHLLRAGLAVCESAKDVVEFLLKHVEEMERASRIAAAPPELVEMAKQVKLILARFAPDNPAVVELKKSPAYQQVAWLIENPASMVETVLQ